MFAEDDKPEEQDEKADDAQEGEEQADEGKEGDGDGEEGTKDDKKSKGGKGKLLLFLLIGIIILIAGGVATAYFLSLPPFTSSEEKSEQKVAETDPAQQMQKFVLYPLETMTVNLRGGNNNHLLRITAHLEVEGNEETKKSIDSLKLRIIDAFQFYLRELEISDIQGSSGLQNVRAGLLQRANTITKPIKVNNVLFDEFLVQ